jgi:hypothetical protein
MGVYARAQEVLAVADRGNPAGPRGLLVLTQGSAIAPFIYTLF